MLVKVLRLLPSRVLLWIRTICLNKKEIIDLIDYVRLDKYIEKTEFTQLNLAGRPACCITEAEWDYPLLNVCFLENMLKNTVYCLANGYRPVIAFHNSLDKENIWEMLFTQPGGELPQGDRECMKCDRKVAPIFFPVFPTQTDIMKYGKLYEAFVIPNDSFRSYWEEEYNSLLQGKRVLGVLCRGTDYVATKPKNHPIQPKVEDVIALVREKMEKLDCDYIYLATEEAAIQKSFEANFPGKIITNQRKYYDEYYAKNREDQGCLISSVRFDRENDSYHKSQEYFSSLFLLSKCDALIAGNCGGSRAALYLNRGKYKYWYLFNLGVYE